MVNVNGTLHEDLIQLSVYNRGLNYGDAVFETVRAVNSKLLFWEDHYFRLMASMRILRMEIPMAFTLEYLESELIKTLNAFNLTNKPARIKLIVYRGEGGLYMPTSKEVGFIISASELDTPFYTIPNDLYEVDIYKDFLVSPNLISTLKTTNKVLNITGSIYAKENGLQNALLLNTDKKVIESLNGNLFLVTDTTIKTPPLADGCLNGIMRKQLLKIVKTLPDYSLIEESVSPFELQKADEMFTTNVIKGIRPITKYRKKEYATTVAKALLQKINVKIRLG